MSMPKPRQLLPRPIATQAIVGEPGAHSQPDEDAIERETQSSAPTSISTSSIQQSARAGISTNPPRRCGHVAADDLEPEHRNGMIPPARQASSSNEQAIRAPASTGFRSRNDHPERDTEVGGRRHLFGRRLRRARGPADDQVRLSRRCGINRVTREPCCTRNQKRRERRRKRQGSPPYLGGSNYVQTEVISVPVLETTRSSGYFLARLVLHRPMAAEKACSASVMPPDGHHFDEGLFPPFATR